ncbi:MAG: AAA family ATPase [Phycisphaerae bacterium]|nr:AAA family ATPase [Phycisphaerae bacterium]
MSNSHWPTATREKPCPACGHCNRCRIAPDGKAAVCWRSGGKVIQCGGANGNGREQHHYYDPPPSRPKRTFTSAEKAIEAATPRGGTLANVWTYPADVMRVARFDLADGSKQFRPVHAVANGWAIGDPVGKLPLYLGDDLPASGPIYIVEGEKCVDAARSIDLPAVTSAHGSSSAGKADWTPLVGRDVTVLPDNDEPGRKYARDVAARLAKLNPPARTKIVALPDLPAGGDIADYIAARDSMESADIAAGIVAPADALPWTDPAIFTGGPIITCLADVEPREIQWLWPGRVPLGRITLLVGRPGEGKSFLTTDMTSRITTGTPWPDGSDCPSGSVILISGEDDPADTIRPRLDAHHADVRRVHLLSMVRRIGEDGDARETMFTLADVVALEAALQKLPDCRLIVVDPIGSYLGGSTDAHRDNEVRGVLAPVAKLAEKYGPAVLIVAHRRKSGGTNADDMALGSRAFTGIARAVWHLCRKSDADDSEAITGEKSSVRLLLPGKNNLAPEGDGLALTIGGQPPSIRWQREPVRMTADDALAIENAGGSVDESRPGPAPIKRDAAAEWLAAELADLQEHPVATLREAAKAAGLSWRTVERVRDQLGALYHRATFGGGYVWRLPRGGSDDDPAMPANMPATSLENETTWQAGEQGDFTGKSDDSVRQNPLPAKSDLLGDA